MSQASEQSNSQKGRQLCHLLVFLCRYKHQSAAILAAESEEGYGKPALTVDESECSSITETWKSFNLKWQCNCNVADRSCFLPLQSFIWTVPTFPRSPVGTPKQLYEATQKQILENLEIAPCSFPYGVPHALFEGIYWGHDESSNYYYTEIHQQGLIYSEFEFWWDRHQSNDPVFIPSAAAILLWAATRFGRKLYQQFGYFGLFDLRIALDGIQDRRIDSSWRMMSRIMDRSIGVAARFSTEAFEEELLSKCKEIIREIYWAFGWDVDDRRLQSDFK